MTKYFFVSHPETVYETDDEGDIHLNKNTYYGDGYLIVSMIEHLVELGVMAKVPAPPTAVDLLQELWKQVDDLCVRSVYEDVKYTELTVLRSKVLEVQLSVERQEND